MLYTTCMNKTNEYCDKVYLIPANNFNAATEFEMHQYLSGNFIFRKTTFSYFDI